MGGLPLDRGVDLGDPQPTRGLHSPPVTRPGPETPLRAIVALLAACQPRATAVGECLSEGPLPGQVVVREVGCADELPIGADGRAGSDVLVANNLFRAIVRAAPTALSVHHTGGGTLIDAAPWTTDVDDLHEVIPQVGGGWLDVDTFELLDDGVRVGGTVVPLPGVPAPTGLGERREIVWRIYPDDPWLSVEGADGLDVHPTGGVGYAPQNGLIQSLTLVHAVDVPVTEDLGGVLRYEGASRLLVSDAELGWAALGASTRHVSGVAEDASEIRLFQLDRFLGRVPLDPLLEGAFDLEVPFETTHVQSRGPGLPSPMVPVGEDLVLTLGTPAVLTVRFRFDGTPMREVALDYTTSAGVAGETLALPDGATLFLEPGQVELGVGGVRELARTTTVVEVPPEGAEVTLAVRERWDPGSRVAVLLGKPTDRDRALRGTWGRTLSTASADGFAYAVLASTDALVGAGIAEDPGRLLFANGVRSTHPDGWSIVSWPWNASSKFSGWGAPDLAGLDAAEALQVATGASTRRFTLVDEAWLEVAGEPSDHRFPPDFVALAAPGVDGPAADWAPWFAWLDQGAALVPTGPVTWVSVADPGLPGAAEIEGNLVGGRVIAGSGPMLELTWQGKEPGGIAPQVPSRPRLPGTLRLAGRGTIDTLALLGSGGVEVARWTVSVDTDVTILEAPDPGAWVVAVGWTAAGGGDWAVTAPVWLDPPG